MLFATLPWVKVSFATCLCGSDARGKLFGTRVGLAEVLDLPFGLRAGFAQVLHQPFGLHAGVAADSSPSMAARGIGS